LTELTIHIVKIGLQLDYYSVAQVIDWADQSIIDGDEDALFIDLSLVDETGPDAAIGMLHDWSEGKEIVLEQAYQYYLGYYHKILLQWTGGNWARIQRELIEFYKLDEFVLNKEHRTFYNQLLNDYTLRELSIAAPMNMPDDLEQFLYQFPVQEEMDEYLEGQNMQLTLKDIAY